MQMGLIARADNRGLGIQTWEAFRHMQPTKTLVVNCSSRQPLSLHLDRYPGATVINRPPTLEDCRRFLDGLDVMFTCETAYNPAMYSEADRMGVRSVLQYNFEFLDHLRDKTLPQPTLFASPSTWRYDDVPFPNKGLLPVPIATERFPDRRPVTATRFLHIVGRPAIHDRNGTKDLLAALPLVQSPITMTIRCQDPGYVPGLLWRRRMPTNVELVIESADTPNYWDNYTGHDVLVMPRRFGGLCLPAQEALGAGMPVIMPDISPNEWLAADWLILATKTGRFMARAMIDLHEVNPKALAAKIDQFADDQQFYTNAAATARDMARMLSWDSMKPVYDKVFAEL